MFERQCKLPEVPHPWNEAEKIGGASSTLLQCLFSDALAEQRMPQSNQLSSAVHAHGPSNRLLLALLSMQLLQGPLKRKCFEKLERLEAQKNGASLDFIPMGKMGKPQEIAAVIEFLFSEDAGFITGQTIYVDGGAHFAH